MIWTPFRKCDNGPFPKVVFYDYKIVKQKRPMKEIDLILDKGFCDIRKKALRIPHDHTPQIYPMLLLGIYHYLPIK